MNTVFKHQYANYQMHNLANGDWITLLTPVPYKVIRSEWIMWMVYLNVMHRIHYNSEQTFTAKLRNFIDIYTSHRIYHKCTHAYNVANDNQAVLFYVCPALEISNSVRGINPLKSMYNSLIYSATKTHFRSSPSIDKHLRLLCPAAPAGRTIIYKDQTPTFTTVIRNDAKKKTYINAVHGYSRI